MTFASKSLARAPMAPCLAAFSSIRSLAKHRRNMAALFLSGVAAVCFMFLPPTSSVNSGVCPYQKECSINYTTLNFKVKQKIPYLSPTINNQVNDAFSKVRSPEIVRLN
jgi:hypothetical protein